MQELKRNKDYSLWHNGDRSIAHRVSAIDKPIVEIGGPTELGFYFLEGVALPTKPLITNISSNPLPFHPKAPELAGMVDAKLDGIKMPYKDAEVGIFLMAAMSLSSDWWVELTEEEKEKAQPTFEAEFTSARLEMGQVAAGILAPEDVKHAQRVKIYLEVFRCLDKGGLFFADGGIEEITILRRIGFELIACLQLVEERGLSYEFVVAK